MPMELSSRVEINSFSSPLNDAMREQDEEKRERMFEEILNKIEKYFSDPDCMNEIVALIDTAKGRLDKDKEIKDFKERLWSKYNNFFTPQLEEAIQALDVLKFEEILKEIHFFKYIDSNSITEAISKKRDAILEEHKESKELLRYSFVSKPEQQQQHEKLDEAKKISQLLAEKKDPDLKARLEMSAKTKIDVLRIQLRKTLPAKPNSKSLSPKIYLIALKFYFLASAIKKFFYSGQDFTKAQKVYETMRSEENSVSSSALRKKLLDAYFSDSSSGQAQATSSIFKLMNTLKKDTTEPSAYSRPRPQR
ncbi:MAG: hypothetical protein V3V61_07845 [Gammaproteobacteria bacterium]